MLWRSKVKKAIARVSSPIDLSSTYLFEPRVVSLMNFATPPVEIIAKMCDSILNKKTPCHCGCIGMAVLSLFSSAAWSPTSRPPNLQAPPFIPPLPILRSGYVVGPSIQSYSWFLAMSVCPRSSPTSLTRLLRCLPASPRSSTCLFRSPSAFAKFPADWH